MYQGLQDLIVPVCVCGMGAEDMCMVGNECRELGKELYNVSR